MREAGGGNKENGGVQEGGGGTGGGVRFLNHVLHSCFGCLEDVSGILKNLNATPPFEGVRKGRSQILESCFISLFLVVFQDASPNIENLIAPSARRGQILKSSVISVFWCFLRIFSE